MICKMTILIWVLYLVSRYIMVITTSPKEKMDSLLYGKYYKRTPIRLLTVLLMYASLIMTVVTAVWMLFFVL